ncbi:MAG: hypothetical protein V1714_02020 [Pseudomonadota bacterium]|jgi:hypothetical protein
MKMLRNTLFKLGWPIDQMSLKQITRELYRRWFTTPHESINIENAGGIAPAAGIIVAMACEGNIDTLIWSQENQIPKEEIVTSDEKNLFLQRKERSSLSCPERRSSPRSPGKDIVRWRAGNDDGALGWLVDYSDNGVAFVIETNRSPQVGTKIMTSILSRSRGLVDLGSAQVVRIEPLNSELSLTCLKLEAESTGTV